MNIKLFKELRDLLSLRLDESEELGTKKILETLPAQYLGHTRQMVQNAYRLKKEARVALEVALKSNNDLNLWERAYRSAQTTDEAAQALLEGQLHCIIVIGGHGLGVLFSIVLAIALCTNNITIEELEIIPGFVALSSIVLLPQIFFIMLPLLYSRQLTSLLMPQSTNEILDAALTASVELDIKYLKKKSISTGEMLADSSSLICQLLNSMNNSDMVRDMKDIEVPDEFICPITYQIMTDPVYSEQNPKRFERTAILRWLKIKHSHPYNERLLLTHDHLKRDFKLKLKTDLFVENLFQNTELKPTKDTLVKLSIFQPQCFTEHDDITDQMMAENAFGRGSNTYRNNHSH